MTIKDIVNRMIKIAGLEGDVNPDVPSAKLEKLIDCVNLIYAELTLQYVHLRTKENIDFVNGRAYYSAFTRKVREIISVRKEGSKIPFIMYPLFVSADIEGKAEVTYIYHFGTLALNDAVELPPQYSEYVVAVGSISEYFYRLGLIEEAAFYKNRYETAVTNLSKRLKPLSLPTRTFR
jgi:hypothetical protein